MRSKTVENGDGRRGKGKPQAQPRGPKRGAEETLSEAEVKRQRTISAQEFMLNAFLTSSPQKPTVPGNASKRKKPALDVLWADKYQPYTQDELCVHKNKVNEVRIWLREAFEGRGSGRVLLCSGPPGCGKTAVIKMLSLELDYDIIEWTNGTTLAGGTFGEPISARFTNFVLEAERYPSLQFGESTRASTKRIILVEDWPNILEPTTRTAVQNAIYECASSSSRISPPLVLILSESASRSDVDPDGSKSSSNGGSIDAGTVIHPHLMGHYAFHRISFNPIATTFMRKALREIVAQEFRSLPTTCKPDLDLIDAIAASSSGDIRSALNNLQFIALKESGTGPRIPSKKIKKGPVRKEVAQLMTAISDRESSMLLFHALGKVLYNKRVGDPGDDDDEDESGLDKDLPMLAQHLQEFDRRPSKVDVADLFVSISMDTSNFILYLQSNYPNFTDTTDQRGEISEMLSQAEALGGRFGYHFQHYQFEVAVRGLLMFLPSPMPRRGQKMVKSDWFDSLRKKRDWSEKLREVKAMMGGDDGELEAGVMSLDESVLATEVVSGLAKIANIHSDLGQSLDASTRRTLQDLSRFQANHGPGQILGEKEVVEEEEIVVEEAVEKYDKMSEDELEQPPQQSRNKATKIPKAPTELFSDIED